MDFLEFLDTMYQGWSKTTGAEDRFYIVEPGDVRFDDKPETWDVWAVAQDESKTWVAMFTSEHDADWFASLHGAFPDLYRNLLSMSDENDKHDTRNDELTGEIAEIAQELAEAKALERALTIQVNEYEERIESLKEEQALLVDEIRDLENYKFMYEELQ